MCCICVLCVRFTIASRLSLRERGGGGRAGEREKKRCFVFNFSNITQSIHHNSLREKLKCRINPDAIVVIVELFAELRNMLSKTAQHHAKRTENNEKEKEMKQKQQRIRFFCSSI